MAYNPQAFSAPGGSSKFQTLTFANSNGVSFTNSNGSIVASVQTNYLTTAALSNHSHGNPTLALTNINGTTASASNGLTLSLSAVVPSQTVQPVAYSAANGSANFSTLTFANSNGISFSTGTQGLYATVQTNYLTTAAQSNHSHNFATTTTNGASIIVGTTNSNGATIGVPAFLTTAQPVGAYLTTARQSNDAIGLNTAQSNVTWTVNSSGISVDARGYAGTGTSATNASVTLNSNGLAISVAAGGGATPVASASNGSFSFTTLGFSNANNVTFGTSAGSIITASVAAPGAAAENNWINILGTNTSGDTTASGSTIGYSGINLTLSGTNGSIVNISAPATSQLTATGILSISSNGSTISLGVPNQIMTVSSTIPHGMFPGSSASQTFGAMGVSTASAIFWPFLIEDYFIGDHIMLALNMSYQSSSVSGQQSGTFRYGIYSNNVSTLSLISSNSFAWSFTNSSVSGTLSFPTSSGTAGFGYGATSHSTTAQAHSLYGTAGLKLLELPFTNTFSLPPGQYWMGVHNRYSSSSANVGISLGMQGNVISQINNRAPIGIFSSGQTTNPLYKQPLQAMGPYTSTNSANYSGTALPVSAFITGIAHTLTIYPCITLDKSQ